ncbi:MAG TPA: AAA family ATPase [Polyangiaceae bacterium]|jgi:predicted ATPase
MAGFLTELHVKGYACLKDVKCALTPLHAFIGPNDSGKSTLLRVIQNLPGTRFPADTGVYARLVDGSDLRINYGGAGILVTLPGGRVMGLGEAQTHPQLRAALSVRLATQHEQIQLVRLSADSLRQSSQLITQGQPLELVGRGTNLAGLYDALRDRSIERFAAISTRVSDFFPSVKALGLRATGAGQKVLAVTLVDGTEVLSGEMSEGLLYYLAFAILGELQRPAAYLVEEPENGLHPSRIHDIIGMLRRITEGPDGVQVLMATHSPLVVNELRPEEVTVVTRDPVTGTHLETINKTPHFAERAKVYALGELWLSYADGKEEAPLFDGEGR